ncbi:metallothionein-like protein 4B [Syzygium oleosum]|uniref:metallothionein-like protein 4B n=1 Tax=Syzygium oleosum TaxID=219896 RepID=UPI0011D2C74A|nr:metallothionein-like protein 4B [Syzygium oleosum]
MADRSGTTAGCNDRCGCPNPCPGRDACRCTSISKASGRDEAHKRCTCGEHCGCNPCSCAKAWAATGTGRLHCRCGNGCTCATCAA